MEIPGKIIRIHRAFEEYTKSGDKTHVADFSIDDLQEAAVHIMGDEVDEPHAKAIRARIHELEVQLSKREKWRDRFINAAFSIVGGVIGGILLLTAKRVLTGTW